MRYCALMKIDWRLRGFNNSGNHLADAKIAYIATKINMPNMVKNNLGLNTFVRGASSLL